MLVYVARLLKRGRQPEIVRFTTQKEFMEDQRPRLERRHQDGRIAVEEIEIKGWKKGEP